MKIFAVRCTVLIYRRLLKIKFFIFFIPADPRNPISLEFYTGGSAKFEFFAKFGPLKSFFGAFVDWFYFQDEGLKSDTEKPKPKRSAQEQKLSAMPKRKVANKKLLKFPREVCLRAARLLIRLIVEKCSQLDAEVLMVACKVSLR